MYKIPVSQEAGPGQAAVVHRAPVQQHSSTDELLTPLADSIGLHDDAVYPHRYALQDANTKLLVSQKEEAVLFYPPDAPSTSQKRCRSPEPPDSEEDRRRDAAAALQGLTHEVRRSQRIATQGVRTHKRKPPRPASPTRPPKQPVPTGSPNASAGAGASAAAGPPPPLDDDSSDALKFRAALQRELPLHPCCVCGIRMQRDELRVHTYSNNVVLLQPLEYSTRIVDNTVHRLGHCTLWTAPLIGQQASTSTPKRYHLLADERANCIHPTCNDTDAELDICKHCSGSLARGNVPSRSYKSVDNGPRPADLPQLTLLEERVLAPARVLRHLLLCRHGGERRTADPSTGVVRLHAHIISFNNPGPDELAALFPYLLP